MTTLNELLKKWPRVVILYPVYLGISEELESRWNLVKEVRENPDKYPIDYVSKRTNPEILQQSRMYNEQIVELFTQLNGKHVEVVTKIYREFPQLWNRKRKEFAGDLLASLPDSPFEIKDDSIYQLRENILDDK